MLLLFVPSSKGIMKLKHFNIIYYKHILVGNVDLSGSGSHSSRIGVTIANKALLITYRATHYSNRCSWWQAQNAFKTNDHSSQEPTFVSLPNNQIEKIFFLHCCPFFPNSFPSNWSSFLNQHQELMLSYTGRETTSFLFIFNTKFKENMNCMRPLHCEILFYTSIRIRIKRNEQLICMKQHKEDIKIAIFIWHDEHMTRDFRSGYKFYVNCVGIELHAYH